MFRYVQQITIIIVLILFLAALPESIVINQAEQTLNWNWRVVPELYGNFFKELSNGSLGTYQLGSQRRLISEDISHNFMTSLQILLAGVNIGVILSMIFGFFISRFRLTRLFNIFLNGLSAIPDFILIIVTLIFAIKFYKYTGIRMISLRPDAGALNIWFPMLMTGFAPTLYLFKLVSVKYYQLSGEDYIKTAVAKGMKINYINVQHLFKNIEPFITAELTKVISLAVGNLFIIEYLLNVSGITKFIFQSKELQPIAIGLFCMLLISIIVFISVKLVFYLFKRSFVHE